MDCPALRSSGGYAPQMYMPPCPLAANHVYRPPSFRYDGVMRLLGDWKWNAALAVFALFAALVVWLPGPGAKPTDALTASSATGLCGADTADMPPSVRPDPTAAEYEAMLQYTVQEGDTVAGIARLFHASEENLRWANHILDGGDFTPGEKIWLPAP